MSSNPYDSVFNSENPYDHVFKKQTPKPKTEPKKLRLAIVKYLYHH